MDAAAGALVVLVSLSVYFIPTIIAASRGHRNVGPIVAINVLLGWTFVGWIGAFIWSLTWQPKEKNSIHRS